MKILLVGSGGREHAIAWKLAQSPRLDYLYIAPGNAGMTDLGEILPVKGDDIPGLVKAAQDHGVQLAVIGPEVLLTMGITDALQAAGVRVFGPTRAAAQIEGSKAFAKAFMARHNIPTARYAVFTELDTAIAHLESVDYPVVIKASGLAAGKGVILPESRGEATETLREMLVERSFGAAGQVVVIEERLEGEEVSLLAFTDGFSLSVMPPSQDHKRLMDGDLGTNTGGMGAYAPAQICPPELVEQVTRTILQPTVDGLRTEGIAYVGVLYAGLMLTPQGPKVLEFNCRFGDPETQAILPLLESDLVAVVDACTRGTLDQLPVKWRMGSSVCVVACGENYPQANSSGQPIAGLKAAIPNGIVFHAGTRRQGDQILTNGGRILGVTAWHADLEQAIEAAYLAMDGIYFEGMHYRKDIGNRGLVRAETASKASAYAHSGVNIDSGNRAVTLMSAAVRSTYSPAVLAGIGAFGGLYDAAAVKDLKRPVLVASTDGVGTKVKLAAQANRYASIGQDIVNHCINDILVQGARPLFFLDYFATSLLKPEVTAEVVGGIAAACREAGCVLLGGETAEMPGVYAPGEFDVAGTIIGMVEYERILPHPTIHPGDLLVGLASSGPHTNGYSLIRKIIKNIPLDSAVPEAGVPLVDALLAPHRSYLPLLQPVLEGQPDLIKGLAHITGGGFIENIPRILPDGAGAVVHWASWSVPPIFRFIQALGKISRQEMARVFNMGIGMVAVVAPGSLEAFSKAIPEPVAVIGEVIAGEKKVTLA
jgi:phosphoribosylamine--glycine ligase / phosphoribosylformylglycinamidine cyclo-ligase